MAAPLSAGEARFVTTGAGGEKPDMTAFSCPACENRVLVRKNGPAQTTVQWLESLRCPELQQSSTENERALIPSCARLNSAIDDAVVAGEIIMSAQPDAPL